MWLLKFAEEECEIHVLSFVVCFSPLIQIKVGLPIGDLCNGKHVFDKFTHAISSQE